MSQWYALIAGQQYGPVGIEELRDWQRAGRLKSSDLVWTEGMPDWQQAASALGDEGPTIPPPPHDGPPAPPPAGGYVLPERGAMILVFGLIGLTVCFPFAIVAWVMGNRDLAEMRQGLRDPSGEGLTNGGRILGIIQVCLVLAGIAVSALFFAAFFGLSCCMMGM